VFLLDSCPGITSTLLSRLSPWSAREPYSATLPLLPAHFFIHGNLPALAGAQLISARCVGRLTEVAIFPLYLHSHDPVLVQPQNPWGAPHLSPLVSLQEDCCKTNAAASLIAGFP
jgi:hypothetical protein